jgi:hypothetical protein
VLVKYVKVFIIVCLVLVVIAPWFLLSKRHRPVAGDLSSDGAGATGDGGCYGDHHGGRDGGRAGSDGGGSH